MSNDSTPVKKGYQPSVNTDQRGYQPKPNGNFGYQPVKNTSSVPMPPKSGSNAAKVKE